MKNIGIVCGYGSVLDENQKNYINSIVEFSTQNKVLSLILSGGGISDESNISEAKLMSELIKAKNSKFELLVEEQSLTTLHNLLYSAQLINALKLSYDTLYIFCDSIRASKVALLSRIIFRGQSVKVIKICRKESAIVYLMQFPSTLIQIAGALLPSVEKKILRTKQNQMNRNSF